MNPYEVQKLLATKARLWALTALRRTDDWYTSWHSAKVLAEIYRPFSFLFGPIQALFVRQDISVTVMLEYLAVLAVL